MTDLTELGVEQAAIVRPGDTLILRLPARSLTPTTAREIKTQVEAVLPGVKIVVLNAEGMAVYRPD